MKNYYGSICKRGKFFHWRYRDPAGKCRMRVIRSETGAKVTNLPAAEKVVALWSKETTNISSLMRKADVLRKVAEVKGLIHRSVVPITEIETAFCAVPVKS